MEKFICPVCRKEFYKKVYKQCQSVYCSQECAYKGRTLGFTKRRIIKPYNCYRKQPIICPVCQNEFIARKYKQKYCSRHCFEISHKTTMSGKNNPAYKNGSSYDKRCWRGDDWDTTRQEIYKRDNYKCRDCGVDCISRRELSKTNSLRLIQCHHIENYKIKGDNSMSNLITLCLACHTERHRKEVEKTYGGQ